jgi:hypothetical protein
MRCVLILLALTIALIAASPAEAKHRSPLKKLARVIMLPYRTAKGLIHATEVAYLYAGMPQNQWITPYLLNWKSDDD